MGVCVGAAGSVVNNVFYLEKDIALLERKEERILDARCTCGKWLWCDAAQSVRRALAESGFLCDAAWA